MGKEEAYKAHETPLPTPPWQRSTKAPDTPYEALMSAEPHQEPDISVIEMLAMRDVLLDAMNILDEEETWVVNSLVFERMSIRQVAAQIGTSKSTILRIKDRAMKKMREHMLTSMGDILEGMGYNAATAP